MNLCQHFNDPASGQIVHTHTLDMDRTYPVLFARRFTTQFEPTFLLTLQAEENMDIKFYLPRRYAEGFDDQDIEDINEGKNIKYIIKAEVVWHIS